MPELYERAIKHAEQNWGKKLIDATWEQTCVIELPDKILAISYTDTKKHKETSKPYIARELHGDKEAHVIKSETRLKISQIEKIINITPPEAKTEKIDLAQL